MSKEREPKEQPEGETRSPETATEVQKTHDALCS